ncbi:MAG: MBL fold metallo-hydrolase [Candidatus Jettenia sp.]|uniref:ODP domain-containing protein n=1 Tax=Candidatus Jettenia caeni TaxID=247490 RepID=I3IKF9_9BACT|nr:MBL fold metallo-hydrolase [Candidatus Jettenia sp. AMX1]MBC6930354.1 MBL fold metallo-hydrolase [Candidatus Jettenia sp.]NUN23125.1 MBL fold metallo-hydrolase [Candidatus Jettenia caeni]KAA0247475.1 MAG: MBL fold metallo-hydrolase [Candidatus Jettenia sp. AMX1]MCE7881951.1 MBL fold metallo-hydrolase [Candidatus Jettenia sp. AMX1]MCQ3928509.1 MBL fold metallo-hydrolase [Candidatus Jettenia sp.]
MIKTTEIAPDIYCISIYTPEFNLQFNQFIVKDDEPLLYHTGMRRMFPAIHETLSKIINPSQIRWVGFSHFEADECGSLNEWLKVAPSAQAFCSTVGSLVNLGDYADRPPRGMAKDEIVSTGKYRFRFLPTPHLPHGWDAGMLFEETNQILFCSDLFLQTGNVEAVTGSDIIDRVRNALIKSQTGPLMGAIPYTTKTEQLLREMAALKPKMLATMHGSAFAGEGERAILDLTLLIKEVLGGR